MTDEPRLNAKVIGPYGPTCGTGRHNMPHPDDTCDEADQWITLRDQIIGDMVRAAWEQFERGYRNASLAGTAFATAVAEPIPPPVQPDVQRALNILGPHLAWDHRYQA